MAGRNRDVRRVLVLALGAFLVFALSGFRIFGGTPQSASEPNADNARKIWDLFVPIFWLSVVVFAIVLGIILVAVVRFRRKPGQPIPPAIHGNTKLEIAWTLAPALILAAIAVPTITTIADLAAKPGPGALNIRVIGQQWWWAFEYPDSGVVTADELHVPAGTTVHLELVSKDVIHSFWAPQLFGKQDVVPGRTNSITFTASTPGEYYGQCAEFCGVQHAQMRFRIVVDPPETFATWLADQQKPPATPAPGSLAAQGEQIFMTGPAGCVACHTINGTNAKGTLGPNLTHVGSRGQIAGAVLPNTAENVAKWVRDTQAIKPGVKMPSFKTVLTPEQVNALAAYLESLK